jgi:hypothetical protein
MSTLPCLRCGKPTEFEPPCFIQMCEKCKEECWEVENV